jgi:propionyl-CoA carboxylase beta chain
MTRKDPRLIELHDRREKTRQGGGPERVDRQHAKGKGTARERLNLLLDPGTFSEIEPYAASRSEALAASDEAYPGDGVVTGFGRIDGRTVYVYAQDFTVLGGTLGEVQAQKICRVLDLAAQNGKPVIGLLDSGGARIQEGIHALNGYGEIFRRNALYSGVIPQVSVMLGPCAGGAAYSPALTDLIVMVEKQSFMFLTGPEVIKAVTNEAIDLEGLGGAEVHTAVSGTAHLAAGSEREALALVRLALGYLPSNNQETPPFVATGDDPRRMDPALDSLVPLDPSEPYAMHTALAVILDRDSLLELMPSWAKNAVIGLARLGGRAVGVVAQEPATIAGVLDIDTADKIARFVRLCDCFNLPLVTFVDSPGFLPGVAQEHGGVIRHGAKVLYAYSEASVPKVSVITRKAYGGSYIVMSSRSLGADLAFAWPSAEIAVMGAEGAVNILYRDEIAAAPDPEARRRILADDYRQRFSSPYGAAAAGFVDDVIAPSETRPRLIAALEALQDKQAHRPPQRHGNMPV